MVKVAVRNYRGMADQFAQAVQQIKQEEARRFVDDYLEPNSPRGAGVPDALRNGWAVLNKGPSTVTIDNLVQAAYYRVVGRGPGQQPPAAKLVPWVRAKGADTATGLTAHQLAFLIARKIGREGTERWKANQNLLDIDARSGRLRSSSRAYAVRDAMEKRINELRIAGR